MSRHGRAVRATEVERYWDAVRARDPLAAVAVVDAALDRGVDVVSVLEEILAESQRRVGEAWAANSCTVSDEHAMTAVSTEVVAHLAARQPTTHTGPPVLMACVEREWHALPALILTEALISRGHHVQFLGADVSPQALVGEILDRGPRAVLLSTSLTSSLPATRRHIEAVRQTNTPVVVGGSAFDPTGTRAQRLGASGWAPDADAADDLLDSLPTHVAPAPPLDHPEAAEATLLHSHAADVAEGAAASALAALGEHPNPTGDGPVLPADDWRSVLGGHATLLVDNLVSALLLLDPGIVREADDWLTGVLRGRGAPATAGDLLWERLAVALREYPAATRLLEDSVVRSG